MRLALGNFCEGFAKQIKIKVFAVVGIALVGIAVLAVSGCNQFIEKNDEELKKDVLKLANQMIQEKPIIPKTVSAVEVRSMYLPKEPLSKRVGYADVVFKSQRTGKTEVLRYDVTVTGLIYLEIQLNNPLEMFKLSALDWSEDLLR